MELFAKLFSSLLVFVYHYFDRIVIHGYLSGLSRRAQKGVRKEDYVRPWLRRLERAGQYGVYFIFQSMEEPLHALLFLLAG
jgi:hypothetical protein